MSVPGSTLDAQKAVHTIILDSSPLLLNTPSISTLLSNCNDLVTTPSVISEIKNEEARSRVKTFYEPFITLRSPKPESTKFVKDFARKTGDGTVLSQTDYEILALAYELECERNGGDWRLRKAPGQKRVNGSPPEKKPEMTQMDDGKIPETTEDETKSIEDRLEGVTLSADPEPSPLAADAAPPPFSEPVLEEYASSSDSEGWITPSNIKKQQARDATSNTTSNPTQRHIQVATMTGDFAMQNVLLQINLNLLSPSTCKRITQIKQFILRCHACFQTSRDMTKQFCPRCGKPTLTRVSCTTNDKGEVRLHLKQNMQWNNRGNVYSIPKPVSGNANGRWQGSKQGGGKGGWGSDLILAEDQKEYVKATAREKRFKAKDLMDEDALPGILSGERGSVGGKPRVGPGRTINSRKR